MLSCAWRNNNMHGLHLLMPASQPAASQAKQASKQWKQKQ